MTSAHRAPSAAIELRGVTRNFGGLKAVDDVTFSIAQGTRHVVIGPNGAGKTTLFALMSGELELSSGQISLFGEDVSAWSAMRRSRAGLGRTYQITNVFSGLTVEENLVLAMRGRQGGRLNMFRTIRPDDKGSQRIDELLAICGLKGRRDTRASAMSYGEQRLLELAIALANEPRLLMLDEPAAGLSPAERGPMAETIRRLPSDLTVVLIEHDMELALGLADRVTCLYYGQVLAEGTPEEVRSHEKVQSVYFGTASSHA
jgi:branched-chain amino acid transport system ATP-binding protein